jgi:hypothetical protein
MDTMNQLGQSKTVKISKARHCFGCERKYEAGAEMWAESFADGGEKWRTWSCSTCYALMKFDFLADGDYAPGSFSEGFVHHLLENGTETPEILLKQCQEGSHWIQKDERWKQAARKGPNPGESQNEFYERLKRIKE